MPINKFISIERFWKVLLRYGRYIVCLIYNHTNYQIIILPQLYIFLSHKNMGCYSTVSSFHFTRLTEYKNSYLVFSSRKLCRTKMSRVKEDDTLMSCFSLFFYVFLIKATHLTFLLRPFWRVECLVIVIVMVILQRV